MGAVRSRARAADGGADRVDWEVLLGLAADVPNAGLVNGRSRGRACLGIDASRSAKVGHIVCDSALSVLEFRRTPSVRCLLQQAVYTRVLGKLH